MRDVYRRFGFALGIAVLALACGEKDASSTKQGSAPLAAAAAVPVSGTNPSQDAAEESAPRSNGGRVTATIDGKDYVWDVPRPDTSNCSIGEKTFRVAFLSSENGTTIHLGTSQVQVTLEDGSSYSKIRRMSRGKDAREIAEDTVTIEGNTITFEGVLMS